MAQPSRPKNLQDLIKQRQQSEFVGRDDQLAQFRANLQLAPGDDQWYPFINVWGQGGVGKTTLLKQFDKLAREAGALVAYTDESQSTVPEAMGRLAEQFAEQGHKLNRFSDRYRLYRQRKQELEADPERPKGLSSLMGKTLVKGGLQLAQQVPVGGAIAGLVDQEAIADQAGEWAAYVAKKFRNVDDVSLVQTPEEILTPLFVEDLCQIANQNDLVLVFDTYEETSPFLDGWILDVLSGNHGGSLPLNITLIIAGRQPLEVNRWADLSGLVLKFPLEAFSDEEFHQYLSRKGITNAEVINIIQHLSGQLPLLVATLVSASPNAPEEVGNPSDTAVDRFLKWVRDPAQRHMAIAAALPRQFNQDTIQCLAPDSTEAEALFNWLRTRPFVKEQPDGWRYHAVVRQQLLRHQRLTSPQSWHTTHSQLGNHFSALADALQPSDSSTAADTNWQQAALAAHYHALCAAPAEGLKLALNEFLHVYSKHYKLILPWAEAIRDAGQDADNSALAEWGERLVRCARAENAGQYSDIVEVLTALIPHPTLTSDSLACALVRRGQAQADLGNCNQALEDFDQAIALLPNEAWSIARRGVTYRQMECYDESIADLTQAIKLKPDYKWALAWRGMTYRRMKHYDEAIADLTQAITLKPDYEWAWVQRGVTYRRMKHYDEAIADLTQAITLKPDNEWALAWRGVTYRRMKHYDEAIADLTQAITLKPDYEWAWVQRGVTYRRMKHYDEAIADLTQAITLKPDYEWILVWRGMTYRRMKHYDEAIADLTQAITLKPDDEWALLERGITYRRMKHYDEAIADLTQAITLKPDDEWALLERGVTYRRMKHYDEAIVDLTQAITLKPDDGWAWAHRGVTYRRMKHYDEAIADLTQAITLKPDYEWAWVQRGAIYLLTRHYDEALVNFNQALTLKPDDEFALAARSVTYRKLKQLPEAKADLSRAIELQRKACQDEPEDTQAIFNLALFYLADEQLEAAQETYRRGLKAGATPVRIREAIQDLDDFIHLFPQHQQAITFRNGLHKRL
jgi:tetratricopeptide (TPR) repeat protein